jgi:hypothetical protein
LNDSSSADDHFMPNRYVVNNRRTYPDPCEVADADRAGENGDNCDDDEELDQSEGEPDFQALKR